MESLFLRNHIMIQTEDIGMGIHLSFVDGEGEVYFEILTRAECVQLAQILLRVSDTLTEGNKE